MMQPEVIVTHVAYCYRSGEIDISSAALTLPKGVIAFAIGPRERLEEVISIRARHSYHAENYLVPGLPEAGDKIDPVSVLDAWVDWAFGEFPMDGHNLSLRRVT